jgi:hypothetical protein
VNRRAFLSLFGVTAAAIAADPELALWRPGAKLISIPSVVAPRFGCGNPITLGAHVAAILSEKAPHWQHLDRAWENLMRQHRFLEPPYASTIVGTPPAVGSKSPDAAERS